ncbi:MAG: hypothetical protein PHF30_04005 [Bacilli bacterium]|nr:hypothetical protein [Bacilli bacterium]
MNIIYIIASDSGTYFSKFLKIMTREKYVHISIALDKDFKQVYSFGRKSKFMFPAGFVNEDLKKICQFFNNNICQIYELKITHKQLYKIKKILKKEYIKNELKYKYNVRGLPMINFNLPYTREYHYVCSQFCGKLLDDSGIISFNKHYSLIKPRDILNYEGLSLIYEGKTIDYINKL